jgi:[histone H3]-trimethyl-L-lysine4 demethylase
LEDLQAWQEEIPNLPFQPEEEECLEKLCDHAQQFRDWIRQFINPSQASTYDEVANFRFFLRKIEGADLLLAYETNFLRTELHKWAPVAPEPPPIIEISQSTRKPRPTKQQKLMAQYGVDSPEDLPQGLRPKRKSEGATKNQPPPLQPADTPVKHTTPPSQAAPPTASMQAMSDPSPSVPADATLDPALMDPALSFTNPEPSLTGRGLMSPLEFNSSGPMFEQEQDDANLFADVNL